MLLKSLKRESVNWKLIAPSVSIILIIIFIVYFLASTYLEKIIYSSAKKRANEIAEVINISVEADGSLANLTRANNSVATFEDINDLYIIEPEKKTVLVSSNYFYTRKAVNDLSNAEIRGVLGRAVKLDNNFFYQKEKGRFIYNYFFIVKASQGISYKKLLLVVDFNSESMSGQFESHLNSIMVVVTMALLLSMLAIYFRTETIVIAPLKNLLDVIDQGSDDNKPVTYEYKSNDEVGRLVSTYNQMVVSEHARKQELIEAKNKSEAAAEAKGNFLSVMSHELRTPMNGVIGGCAFLEKSSLSDEQLKNVNMIKGSARQLLSLMNDILDFSKIESGNVTLDIHPIDLQEMIEQVFVLFERAAHEKGLALKFIRPENNIPYLLGDDLRLKQVLINLISNAIKFTSDGSINIRFKKIENLETQISFVLEIEDTGIGIEEAKANELFRSFTQADTSTTRKYGGTGLGLAISKQLTELMGGKIWYESELGKGTRFYISLQLETTDEPLVSEVDVQPEAGSIQIKPAKILLVEDTEVNRIIAEEILSGVGHEVSVAENGQEAVILFEKESFDLVLMDCFMPVMDGFESTSKIRQFEAENNLNRVPIIALTADVTKENKEKCLQAGMDDFLVKPYEPQDLIAKLTQFSQ